jgi:hypothetical protein
MVESSQNGLSLNALAHASSRRRRSASVTSGRGTVRADGFLDHGYNERREMFGTLRVLAVSLAVMALIMFIALYLRHWLAS